MSQPKHFSFGEDETMLRDSAKKFFQDNCPIDKIHKLVASNPDPDRTPESLWDKDLWKQMVDLGWTAVAVPESADGLGMPTVAAACLAEEAGRVAYPGPLLTTLNSSFVLSACETSTAIQALTRIVSGESSTLAITDSRGSWNSQDTDVTAEEKNGSVMLSGTSYFVQDARKADFFIVKAKSDHGIGLYIVNKDANGLSIKSDSIIDLTRDQGQVSFSAVSVSKENIVAQDGDGDTALNKAEPAILTLLAADMVGAAEWQLQTTVEYAKTRVQFDRPIGFFQAVKHPLVDLMVMIDQAKSHVYNAACAIDHEPENAELYARMAKSSASDTADYGSSRSVQYHGGIGFTWECFVHLYFKRQKHNIALFGDATHQRAKMADLLMGPITTA